jgi:prepilin-type N-terminal cleavage/methylation domain-containing protein
MKVSNASFRVADESGLTLIELLIGLTVLGLLFGPITSGFLLAFLETNATHQRVADSASAQLLSSFLLPDVQGSDEVSPTGDFTGTGCAMPSLSGAASTVLSLYRDDPRGPETTVLYLDVTGEGGQHELHRAECTHASGTGQLESTMLVHNLHYPNGFVLTCDGSGCASRATPRTVTIEVTERSRQPQPNSSYTGLTLDFEILRRVG